MPFPGKYPQAAQLNVPILEHLLNGRPLRFELGHLAPHAPSLVAQLLSVPLIASFRYLYLMFPASVSSAV